jgi:formamidopyrimidine-DNA glycosylase
MPELAEVETIKLGLEDFILNKTLTEVAVLDSKTIVGDINQITGTQVSSLSRLGKALFINFSNDWSIMIHLKMTGQLVYRADNNNDPATDFAGGHPTDAFVHNLPDNSTRVVFSFGATQPEIPNQVENDRLENFSSSRHCERSVAIYSANSKLFFNDQRRFGYIKVLRTDQIKDDPFVKKLGPEANVKGNHDAIFNNIKHHQRQLVKATILDQQVLAGVGNIYADESLWMSKIHPASYVAMLNDQQLDLLVSSIEQVLNKSIACGGSTLKNYLKADGTTGDYLDLFANVYNRTGLPCRRCNTPIIKIKTAGRGTHFCPICQVI